MVGHQGASSRRKRPAAMAWSSDAKRCEGCARGSSFGQNAAEAALGAQSQRASLLWLSPALDETNLGTPALSMAAEHEKARPHPALRKARLRWRVRLLQGELRLPYRRRGFGLWDKSFQPAHTRNMRKSRGWRTIRHSSAQPHPERASVLKGRPLSAASARRLEGQPWPHR